MLTSTMLTRIASIETELPENYHHLESSPLSVSDCHESTPRPVAIANLLRSGHQWPALDAAQAEHV